MNIKVNNISDFIHMEKGYLKIDQWLQSCLQCPTDFSVYDKWLYVLVESSDSKHGGKVWFEIYENSGWNLGISLAT